MLFLWSLAALCAHASAASHGHAHAALEARDIYNTPTTLVALQESEFTYSGSSASSASSAYSATETVTGTTTVAPSSVASTLALSLESDSESSSLALASLSSSTATGALELYASAHGIAFSQYDSTGLCKSEETLAQNFAAMSGYLVVRLYNTDCDLVSAALKYKSAGQKLLIGIYDPTQISAGVSIIEKAFLGASNASFSNDIHAISVGNEHVNDGKYTASQMVSYLGQAQSELKNIGYSGDILVIDTFNAIQSNPLLCTNEYTTFVGANAHAFFSGVESLTAGSWVESTISDLKEACGKKVLITETGWPTQGSSIGSSKPSTSDQAAALKSIVASVADSLILFSGWNEGWKQDGDYGVEKYWGINHYDG